MILLAVLLALAGTYILVIRRVGLGRLSGSVALRNARMVRWHKLEKPPVVLITLQKSGSTLLCYLAALINVGRAPLRFRNDFDLVPMLSFPTRLLPQNFNARQDGTNQLYKANGYLNVLEQPLRAAMGDRGRIVWMCREFGGYYRSTHWWVRVFFSRLSPTLAYLRWTNWSVFKALTIGSAARLHVEDLWYAYRLRQVDDSDRLLFLAYEQVTADKPDATRRLAEFLGTDLSAELVDVIDAETSKAAMAEGDRFDPVRFGDGGGVSKVNLEPHEAELTPADRAMYDAIFRKRFEGTGIGSYEDLIEILCARTSPHDFLQRSGGG